MIGETIVSILFGICMGVAATVTMDVLGSVYRRVGLTVGAKGQWVGRWYLGVARGQFTHSNIADSPEIPGEGRAALIGHYIIGTTLSVFYVVVTRWLGVSPSGFISAIGYGLVTCVFPWFLVFPSLGFGAFGRKGPQELKIFRSSLMNHFSYGFGLWWTANLLQLITS
jgi:DUF2938 family protein